MTSRQILVRFVIVRGTFNDVLTRLPIRFYYPRKDSFLLVMHQHHVVCACSELITVERINASNSEKTIPLGASLIHSPERSHPI